MENLISVKQLGEKLGVSRSIVYKLVHVHKFPHVRFGRAIRFNPEKIEQWIKNWYTIDNKSQAKEQPPQG